MWVSQQLDDDAVVAGTSLPVYHTLTKRVALGVVISVTPSGYADVNVGGARHYVRVES